MCPKQKKKKLLESTYSLLSFVFF